MTAATNKDRASSAKVLGYAYKATMYHPEWMGMIVNPQGQKNTMVSCILLSRVHYWYTFGGNKPFYKFVQPPKTFNKAYKPGDSWTEEVGCSYAQYNDAIKRYGLKLTIDNVRSWPELLGDRYLVGYITARNHITWYYLNMPLLSQKIDQLYAGLPSTELPSSYQAPDKPHGDDSENLNQLPDDSENLNHMNQESRISRFRKAESDITNKQQINNKETNKPAKSKPSQGVNNADILNAALSSLCSFCFALSVEDCSDQQVKKVRAAVMQIAKRFEITTQDLESFEAAWPFDGPPYPSQLFESYCRYKATKQEEIKARSTVILGQTVTPDQLKVMVSNFEAQPENQVVSYEHQFTHGPELAELPHQQAKIPHIAQTVSGLRQNTDRKGRQPDPSPQHIVGGKVRDDEEIKRLLAAQAAAQNRNGIGGRL